MSGERQCLGTVDFNDVVRQRKGKKERDRERRKGTWREKKAREGAHKDMLRFLRKKTENEPYRAHGE
eukprot:1358030-Amorphochlora_amoeboformis.AAC.1